MKTNQTKLATVGAIASLAILPTAAVFAATGTTVTDTVEVTINSACTITTTNASNTYSATMTNSQLKSDLGSTAMTINCNDAGGWHVTAVGTGADTTNKHYMNASGSGTDIATGTATSGDTSNWAMKVTGTGANGFTTFSAVPSSATDVAYGDSSVAGAVLNTMYQVWISPTQQADTYTGQVTYTLSHPYTPPQQNYIMQEVSTWKNSLQTGDEVTATDSRDGKTYTVAKLADGKIWMTQNLDLDLTAGDTLTHADTDLGYTSLDTSATWTVGEGYSTIHSNTDTFSGWNDSYTVPYSADPGDIYYYTSGSDSDDTKYSSLSACTGANHTEAECKHYHAGNYYSWNASIATNDSSTITSGDAPNSICPAGWRLPNGSGTLSNNDFANLFADYGVIDDVSIEDDEYATNGFNIIRSQPLYFVRSGLVNGGSLSRAANRGFYWSSTVSDNGSNARALNFRNNSVYPANNPDRNIGYSLRCIAR